MVTWHGMVSCDARKMNGFSSWAPWAQLFERVQFI